MKTRIVVTGMGVITPVGNDVESLRQGLKDKTAGIGPIAHFDTTGYKCELAVKVKGFDPRQYMDAKATRHVEAFSQFAVVASKKALEQSDTGIEGEDLYRIDMCIGSGIGSLQAVEKDMRKLNDKGPSRVNPPLVPLIISSMVAGNIAIQFGLKGRCFNMVTACVIGIHSIDEVFRSIQYGEAGVMMADGTEASIVPVGIAEFISLTASNTIEDVSRASILSDENRNGFVMGEGAGMIVLESLEHAEARGANILAEIVGCDAICDAFHIISPTEDGSGVARVMESAVKGAGITAENIDYVSVHGTSTRHNGLFKTKVIRLALGGHTQKVKIDPTKSMVGHFLGIAGGVEFITCVRSIQDGPVHTTAGLKKPGEGCDLDHTMSDGVSMSVDVVISNSLGSGGHNTSLIVRKFSEQQETMSYERK